MTMGFLDQPILVHNPGYVVLTQFVIVASELFVSSEIRFTDLPVMSVSWRVCSAF